MKNKFLLLPILSFSLLIGCAEDKVVNNFENVINNNVNIDGEKEESENNVDNGNNNTDVDNNNENIDDKDDVIDDVKKDDDKPNVDPVINTYTITWNNYDGSLFNTTTVKEGELPSCNTLPTRSDTEDATYSFKGWEPSVTKANANVTYTATFDEHLKQKPIELSTIAEVRELCKTLTGLNQAGIKVDETIPVRIQGFAFHKMTLVKTVKKYGYNESYPNKVFLGDSTGYIACASNNTDHSLYHKVNDYAGNEKSKYEVYGYISMYMNQPEIYVPDNSSESTYFTYNSNLQVEFDYKSFSVTKTILDYYNDFSTISYNCAGHGYKDIVTINNVSIIDSVDSDTYIGTDGERIIKLKKGLASISKGKVYNLTGLAQLNRFIPSINLFTANTSSEEFKNLNKDSVISLSISDYISTFRSIPFDDTDKNVGETIKKFQYAYKLSGYVSAYNKNDKLYVTLEENYNSSTTYPTREASVGVRKSISIRNDNCWNVTQDQVYKFSCFKDYFDENIRISACMTPILYDDLTYSSVKYHELKNFVFESTIKQVEERQ